MAPGPAVFERPGRGVLAERALPDDNLSGGDGRPRARRLRGPSASDKVACKDEKRIEGATLLYSPPSRYTVDKVPRGEADDILDEFPHETRKEISRVTAIAATEGKSVAVVYALTSA